MLSSYAIDSSIVSGGPIDICVSFVPEMEDMWSVYGGRASVKVAPLVLGALALGALALGTLALGAQQWCGTSTELGSSTGTRTGLGTDADTPAPTPRRGGGGSVL